MLGDSYTAAVRKTFMPEWVSMNAVMAGMAPVMVILMTRSPAAMEPATLQFWGIMSLATLAGALLAYPVNVWLVARGLKHGTGTEQALGKGGEAIRQPEPHPAATRRESRVESPGASRSEILLVILLTLLLLATAIVIAGVYGDFSMSGHP